MSITDEQIAKLKTEHPEWELHQVTNPHATVIIRGPTIGEYERFLNESRDKSTQTSAQRILVTACVVHPPKEEFAALLQRRPALVQVIIDEVVEVAGAEKVTERKKL